MDDLNRFDGEQDIERSASRWVARLTSGHASNADVAAATEWCAQSDSHKAAFERARRLWEIAGAVPAQASWRAPAIRRFAAAAALLLTAGTALLAVKNDWSADYRTSVGEQRRIELDDGSHMTLDSGSAVDIQYTKERRVVSLRRGNALFEVKHDGARPFVVRTEQLTATDVGTVYAVKREGTAAEVIVMEGEVSVEVPGAPATTINAGEHLVHVDGTRTVAAATINADDALAWRRGRLVFDLVPLDQVVAELNRHRPGYIVIANAALRDRKVSGVFHLDDLDDGLRTLSAAFQLRVTPLTPYLVLLR